MIRDIAEFKVGQFTDFEGKERKFIVCALSYSPINGDDYKMRIGWDDWGSDEFNPVADVNRVVSIGVSICNPVDEFDVEIGKRIAQNKAEKDECAIAQIYTPTNGIINLNLVDALLADQVNYVSKYPEKIFKGYASAKKRYEKEKEYQELLNSVDDNHRTVYHMLKEGLVDLKQIIKLLKWKR